MTVALAYSDSAEGLAALRVAVREAQVRDQPLVVLHVPGRARDDQPVPTVSDALTEQVRTHLAAAGGSELEWRIATVMSGGSVGEALVDLAVEAAADVLVIGTRRRTAVGKLLMGSTVQRVVLDAPMAVLVAKPE